MPTIKTPGVYIQEISTLPASIAPVATAIPAFIGYTRQALKNNDDAALINVPVRVTSLLEYVQIFGEAYQEKYEIIIGSNDTITVTNAAGSSYVHSPYTLFYNVQAYFANGGGPCYILSVGKYASTPSIVFTDLYNSIDKLEQEDEVTLLVVPEAISLPDANRKAIYDKMLAQCAKLQDRFAILDVEYSSGTVHDAGADFRNNSVGPDDLKYGAAYFPPFLSDIQYAYDERQVVIRTESVSFADMKLFDIGSGIPAKATITINDNNQIDGDAFTINGTVLTEGAGNEFVKGDDADATAVSLTEAINQNITGVRASVEDNIITVYATSSGVAGNSIPIAYSGSPGAILSGDTLSGGVNFNKSLYNLITSKLQNYYVTLYPSATMAGIYARIDRDRGVWKAPANTTVMMAQEPAVMVSDAEQGELNVDATSGKSINVIRKFEGKGMIVWGARTLAGNDNEWRYISVRRFFNFVEESTRKATEFVVFEPNDSNTWIKVRGMIENFLFTLWRDGALAGAKPEDAFFVRVGLGKTMTAQDILEGKMNVEIGMAVVRPAEFIVLKFSHKLQES